MWLKRLLRHLFQIRFSHFDISFLLQKRRRIEFLRTTSHRQRGVAAAFAGNLSHGLTKMFYISIPSTKAHPAGEVDEINPGTMKVTRIFTTICGPAGLA